MLRPRRSDAHRPLVARIVAAALLITSLAGRADAGEPTAKPRSAPASATPCSPEGTTSVAVDWAGPAGAPVSAIKLRLTYPAAVTLPGSGATAKSRFKNTPEGSIVVVNDVDDAVEALVSRSGSLPAGRLFEVEFDRCAGAVTAGASEYTCAVLDCASSFGPVRDCSCSVTGD